MQVGEIKNEYMQEKGGKGKEGDVSGEEVVWEV